MKSHHRNNFSSYPTRLTPFNFLELILNLCLKAMREIQIIIQVMNLRQKSLRSMMMFWADSFDS